VRGYREDARAGWVIPSVGMIRCFSRGLEAVIGGGMTNSPKRYFCARKDLSCVFFSDTFTINTGKQHETCKKPKAQEALMQVLQMVH